MKKNIILFLSVFIQLVHCTPHFKLMNSSKKNILLMIGKGKNNWTISPEINPDYLNLFNETEKVKQLKFVSDIDSLSFNAKLNMPIKFGIILDKKDTAWVVVNFTNKLPQTLTNVDKIAALSYFWSEVKYNFAFSDRLHFNLDSLYQVYIPKVTATKNDYDFYQVMNIFGANMKDLHTGVYYTEKGTFTDYIPLIAKYFNDELYIVGGREDIINQIPLGSKILRINHLIADDYISKYIEPHINSNFKLTVRHLTESLLFSNDLKENVIELEYYTPKGKILSFTPPRNGNTVNGKRIGIIPNDWKKPIDLVWEKGKIARLIINTFNNSDYIIKTFENLKDTLYKAKGLIIDLRKNGGGSTNTGIHILKYIIQDKFFLTYAWQTRINNGVKKATGNFIKENELFYKNIAYQTFEADTIFIDNSIRRFNYPIAILISENTCSAAEDFLIMLKERKDRPVLIGRCTMGSTGSPLVLDKFPPNGMAKICTRRVLYPYSQKTFDEGISPDILVNYTLEEYLNQNLDKDVNFAIEYLLKQIVDFN